MADGERFVVAGAGLAGSLAATALARAGYRVDVFEKRPDPRREGAVGGRSINLALSVRGIHALEEVGVADEVLGDAIPMRGRAIHGMTGAPRFQAYGKDADHAIHSVSRGGLNLALVEAAERVDGVSIRFGQPCESFDPDSGRIVFRDAEGGERTEIDDAVVVGADGAFSVVRRALEGRDRFSHRHDYLDHGYKELTIPPRDGEFALDPNALHIWPRGTFMMIALPNPDRSFTCTLFWPFSGFAALRNDDEVEQFFDATFPDAVGLMPTLCADYRRNPTSSLVTVRCHPWTMGDRLVLIGDACHAVVPFYGQGMNAAFEDVTVLMESLRRHGGDRCAAFREYGERRKVHVDALADLAIENFVEMRDRTASAAFRWKKRIEKTLSRVLPFWYVPLYTMVSFSRIPYADAVARARRQTRIVKSVAALLVVALLALLITLLGGGGS